MIRVVPVIGVPASGKTTIFRRVITRARQVESPKTVKYGTVRGYLYQKQKLIILGIYDADPFGGTDRLSMAVSPEVQKFIRLLNGKESYAGWTVAWEGDRLASGSLFDYIRAQGIEPEVFCVTANQEAIERRQKTRSNKQDATWRAGRESKVNNLRQRYPVKIIENSVKLDLDNAAERLYSVLTGTTGKD